MLVLTRKPGEKVVIKLGELLRELGVSPVAAAALGLDPDHRCDVVVTKIKNKQVSIGFGGFPDALGILREECL